MIDQELNDAVESARSKGRNIGIHDADGGQYHSRELVIGILKNVLDDVPDYWSVRDLLDKLETL